MNAQAMDNLQKKVLVMGSAILDVVLMLSALPKSGGDESARPGERMVGGCAYNVANILKRLQTPYDLMVPVGSGVYAEQIQAQLQKDGHGVLVHDPSGDNGWCLSLVEQDGERTFITVSGIESTWKEQWFDHVNVADYDYIYLSGYSFEGESANVILRALQKKKPEARVIFDPSPRASDLNTERLEELYALNPLIHCNRSELQALTGEKDVEKGARRLQKKTREAVVVTLGGEGAFYLENEEAGQVSGSPVTPVDTIGAGDAHTGGFIAALVQGRSLKDACILGNQMAHRIIQVQGGTLPS